MRRLVINAAMIPSPGTWQYTLITSGQAREWLRAGPFESYVGYEQTATFLQQLAAVDVPVNRAKVEGVRPGDQALVCRLAYRVQDPKSKGEPQPEDYEFGLLAMVWPDNRRKYHCATCADALGELCGAKP